MSASSQRIPVILVVASLAGSLAGVVVIFGTRGRRQMARVRRQLGPRALPTFIRRAARRTAIPFGPFLALGAVIALYVPSITLPFSFVA